jgi:hypothetical protein
VTVVVFLLPETGVYFGDTDPAPREEDNALGFGYTVLIP